MSPLYSVMVHASLNILISSFLFGFLCGMPDLIYLVGLQLVSACLRFDVHILILVVPENAN